MFVKRRPVCAALNDVNPALPGWAGNTLAARCPDFVSQVSGAADAAAALIMTSANASVWANRRVIRDSLVEAARKAIQESDRHTSVRRLHRHSLTRQLHDPFGDLIVAQATGLLP